MAGFSTRFCAAAMCTLAVFAQNARADEQKFSPPSQFNDSYGKGIASASGLLFIGTRGGYLPDSQQRSGYVELYTRGASEWNLQRRIVAVENTVEFGSALAVEGDWLIVKGAFAYPNPRSVFVFHRVGTDWLEVQHIDRPQTDSSEFGETLALHDGHLVVSAMDFDQEGGSRTGHAYAYELSGESFVANGEIARPLSMPYDAFGQAIAFAGDRLIVASPQYSNAAGIGAVFSYVFQQGQWVHLAALRPASADATSFGASLTSCFAGGQLIVGARSANAVGSSTIGYLQIYQPTSVGWSLARAPLRPQSITAPVEFPSALACEGSLLAVVAADANRTYSFRFAGGDWQEAATYSSFDAGNAGFFRTVAISAQDVIVSDERQMSGIYQVGAAYAFKSDTLFADSFE